MSEGGNEHSIMGLTVPLINAVLVGVWLTGTTITLTVQWYTVKGQISELSRDVNDARVQSAARIAELEADLSVRTFERWTRIDQQLWCSETEKVNENFRCAPLPPPTIVPKTGRYNFWKQGKADQDRSGG